MHVPLPRLPADGDGHGDARRRAAGVWPAHARGNHLRATGDLGHRDREGVPALITRHLPQKGVHLC